MTFKEAKKHSHEAKQLCEAGKYTEAAALYDRIVNELVDDPGGWVTYWKMLAENCRTFARLTK